jgi:hypothetical protein
MKYKKKESKTIDGDKFIPCSDFEQIYQYHRTNKKSAISNKLTRSKNSKRNNPKKMGL